jgi:hypothetical protein
MAEARGSSSSPEPITLAGCALRGKLMVQEEEIRRRRLKAAARSRRLPAPSPIFSTAGVSFVTLRD